MASRPRFTASPFLQDVNERVLIASFPVSKHVTFNEHDIQEMVCSPPFVLRGCQCLIFWRSNVSWCLSCRVATKNDHNCEAPTMSCAPAARIEREIH